MSPASNPFPELSKKDTERQQKYFEDALKMIEEKKVVRRQETKTSTVFEGQLRKESPKLFGLKNWERRWCLLSDHKFEWFYKKGDHMPRGIINFNILHARCDPEENTNNFILSIEGFEKKYKF